MKVWKNACIVLALALGSACAADVDAPEEGDADSVDEVESTSSALSVSFNWRAQCNKSCNEETNLCYEDAQSDVDLCYCKQEAAACHARCNGTRPPIRYRCE